MSRLENPALFPAKSDAVFIGESPLPVASGSPESTALTLAGEQFVGIRKINHMPPFLMSVVSNGNLWLFAGSNAPFIAGRGDADHALFPYRTADKILSQPGGSGARSIFLVERDNGFALWEPWTTAPVVHRVQRNLFKSEYGTSVLFEEINQDFGLRFAWQLTTSDSFGLVRFCTLENLSGDPARVRYLDGWNQLVPAGVGQDLYDKYSYLAAAYMRHESRRGLGLFTLNSAISDRAEPVESLRVAAAWSLGHADPAVLLCERQLAAFRSGRQVRTEDEVRGEFGAYLVCDSAEIGPGAAHEWVSVADTGLDHAALVRLQNRLASPRALKASLVADVIATRDGLKQRIAAADGMQMTADATASTHHFANVLFNCMRGGTLPDDYRFPSADFAAFLRRRNVLIHARHALWLERLPAQLDLPALREQVAATGDAQFIRLAGEYLPLTFSRRHGDPSRPWNRFSIRTRDESGRTIYDYQGNWRDIFQNWEGLAQSYPACLGSMIAIFLNASTADGYNPYRITRGGIDWEVEDPHDPWSHIGYWGDHQIIYLLRLLESCERFEPGQFARHLNENRFAYANVPYEIKDLLELVHDPRNSIHFNAELHRRLLARATELGNDGRLRTGADGGVLLVSLAEKLLVPLLAKLGNFVPGGGIWLNTQRPEWNDANNALAGWGLSLVTVAYLRRYLGFLDGIFASAGDSIRLSGEVARFVRQLSAVLPSSDCADDTVRLEVLTALGKAAQEHRHAVYHGDLGAQIQVPAAEIRRLLTAATRAVDATLRANRRGDGLFHSYNLLELSSERASVRHLHLMLEGQVAVLSSGLLEPREALSLLQALRHSELFRADQHSYLLYPDREVTPFQLRNTLPPGWQKDVPAIAALVAAGNRDLIVADEDGHAHFQADIVNTRALEARLNQLAAGAPQLGVAGPERAALLAIWETVFQHSAFTGRSGSMFGFEGLGCIYWHMIAKLLVAAEENHRRAIAGSAPAEVVAGLRAAYYDIRRGLGFTKSPEVYGAFPTDPYSHTPRHAGAQQPGMTGQVKEEILTRWAELGVSVENGCLTFVPALLRRSEFLTEPGAFVYFGASGAEQRWPLPAGSLAFTCCRVPVCYRLADAASIQIEMASGEVATIPGGRLPPAESREVFLRTGRIARITVAVARGGIAD
jgi:hypothetical protein